MYKRKTVSQPIGCEIVIGDALDGHSYRDKVPPASIFIHLVGVPHPSPSKKDLFRTIDLTSVQQAAIAAKSAGIDHFIYLSVAQYPTEIMKDYQLARAEGEACLLQTGLMCSFLRPWYVLGPGHWWPIVLKPFFWLGRFVPGYREAVEKLNTVTIRQMIATLLYAIKHPPVQNPAVYEVNDFRRFKV